MTNFNSSVYLCKEVFDENCEPSKFEIVEQALRLGIDPTKELHLLCIAKQCLLEPLPANWLPCFIEKENKYFYYNKEKNISQWEHPLDEYYRNIVEKIRSEDSSTGQDISLNIILDEDNSLNTMYQTQNNIFEKKAVNEKRTVRFKTPIEESLELDDFEDNMKFLGPIKLNTPYTGATSTLQNLPQFSTSNTFDTRTIGSRSLFSKYNVLPTKEDLSKKNDNGESIKNINDESNMSLDFKERKENLRKIDITLTESIDRSESTSSEIHSTNFNSDYEKNERDDGTTTIQMNCQEKNQVLKDDERLASAATNESQFVATAQMNYIKKDDLISDSGNSTAKDSKILQLSTVTNSFSATKKKMAEITQRFPLNQHTNEIKFVKTNAIENNERISDLKSNDIKPKFNLSNCESTENKTLLDAANIKVIIENHCDLIKNKLEGTIKTKENIFREEIIKQIDDAIRKQKDSFEKHFETRNNELYAKNEIEIKSMIKNMQEKSGNSLIEECDKKLIQNVSDVEKMCAENLKKFQKDIEDYAELFKSKIQMELDVLSNELKKEFSKSTEKINANWNQTLESYENIELEKVKKDFEQSRNKFKSNTDNEIHRLNLELKDKLRIISEDRLKTFAEKLDLALSDEIVLVKKRINENCQHDLSVNTLKKEPRSKLCIGCSERELNSEYRTRGMLQVNYSDIKKKIQHCSNELNDALELVNEVTYPSERTTNHEQNLYFNKCTVSCQTENTVIPQSIPSIKKYSQPQSSNISLFNTVYDVDTKYTDYWNQAKMSDDIRSNYIAAYSQILNPLDILSREAVKVNAAEQNICRLIDTFSNMKYSSFYHPSNNNNNYHNKFSNICQTSKQIAYDRTKDLREWLYQTDLKNGRNMY